MQFALHLCHQQQTIITMTTQQFTDWDLQQLPIWDLIKLKVGADAFLLSQINRELHRRRHKEKESAEAFNGCSRFIGILVLATGIIFLLLLIPPFPSNSKSSEPKVTNSTIQKSFDVKETPPKKFSLELVKDKGGITGVSFVVPDFPVTKESKVKLTLTKDSNLSWAKLSSVDGKVWDFKSEDLHKITGGVIKVVSITTGDRSKAITLK